MKIKFVYIILFAITFTYCKRKKTETDPRGILAEYPAHCYNNTFDSLEMGSDCGGSCKPCNIPVPMCTQSTNNITFNSASYSVTNVNCGNLYDNNNYDFRGSYGNGTITIRIWGSLPDISASYPAEGNTEPDYGKAYVSINSFSYGNMYAVTGTVFVNQVGGKYYATVCGASFYSFVTSQTYNGSMNISCQ